MEIAVIFDNLLDPLKRLTQLINKFKFDFQVPPFWKMYEKDPELLDLQQKLNDGCNIFFFAVFFWNDFINVGKY